MSSKALLIFALTLKLSSNVVATPADDSIIYGSCGAPPAAFSVAFWEMACAIIVTVEAALATMETYAILRQFQISPIALPKIGRGMRSQSSSGRGGYILGGARTSGNGHPGIDQSFA
ncbi:hypothetical protein N431DRAFT_454816 [Stipitochalara longipes BDJ]|nr:hypothetical protein N431DRAFT_454816 [Stipitochalara longipes BDJ]